MILSITNHSSYFRNASLRTTKGQNGVGIYIIEHCVLPLVIISIFFYGEEGICSPLFSSEDNARWPYIITLTTPPSSSRLWMSRPVGPCMGPLLIRG